MPDLYSRLAPNSKSYAIPYPHSGPLHHPKPDPCLNCRPSSGPIPHSLPYLYCHPYRYTPHPHFTLLKFHRILHFTPHILIYHNCVPLGKDRTLFLRLLEAEKSGLITVTVEPPMMLTSTGWEKDASPFLMNARFAMQVLTLTLTLWEQISRIWIYATCIITCYIHDGYRLILAICIYSLLSIIHI